MNLKKPKFWDYKKPNIYAYLLLPITILINLFNFFKIKKNKTKFKNRKTLIKRAIGDNIYAIIFGFL